MMNYNLGYEDCTSDHFEEAFDRLIIIGLAFHDQGLNKLYFLKWLLKEGVIYKKAQSELTSGLDKY